MKDPELSYGQVFGAIGIGLAVVFSSGDRFARLDWLDTTLVFLSIGLIAWLSLPRRLVDPKGHQSTRQGIAFLAGKKLNRIWRRLRRNATASH